MRIRLWASYGRAMRIDSRAAALIVIAVIALILFVTLPRGTTGGDGVGGYGGPGGDCPPGHVTIDGCAKR
jgi:hypothetical protein